MPIIALKNIGRPFMELFLEKALLFGTVIFGIIVLFRVIIVIFKQ